MRHTPPVAPADVGTAAALLRQLAEGSPLDVSQFWRDVDAMNMPLVTEVAGDRNAREVTFLWRAERPLQGVYVRLNRVTDKSDVDKGLMRRLPSSDIWILTLRLPATYCGSYTIVEIPQGTPADALSQLGGRFSPLSGQADPLNKTPGINVRGVERESVLALDQAPAQDEWARGPHCFSGSLSVSQRAIAGRKRRVRLYLPDVPAAQPLGMLVLPDGETWFDHVGVAPAIDAAINNGRIPPVAVLGVDNVDERDRTEILGGRRELVLDIAGRLLPEVMAEQAHRCWAGRSQTVLAGQSLGGVTALMAARHAADTFGLVLCHSPSMWWTPDGSGRPFLFSSSDTSWVSEHLLSAPPQTVRVRLCVGSLEGSTVPHVQQLHQRLLAAGVDSRCAIYTGGHDYAWWRGALIDGLALLSS